LEKKVLERELVFFCMYFFIERESCWGEYFVMLKVREREHDDQGLSSGTSSTKRREMQ
jgi:hypothetical protein